MDDKATVIDHNQLTRSKRNTTLWITDTTIISICNIIVIAATSRELFFYDITSSIYKCLHKLCGKLIRNKNYAIQYVEGLFSITTCHILK